jgi:thiol-disulfide isomerase/thioredoxin
MVSSLVFVLCALATATAAEPGLVDQADYLRKRRRYQEAVATVSEALEADPEDLWAHDVYVLSARRAGTGDDHLVPMYRAWHEASPGPAATYGLARSLLVTEREPGAERCAEADALLSSLPESVAFEAHWARWWDAPGCDWDRAAIGADLAAMDHPRAWPFGVYLRAIAGEDVRSDLAEVARVDVRMTRYLAKWILRQTGRVAKGNQRALRAAVEPYRDSETPAELYLVYLAARDVDQADAEALMARLDALEGRTPTADRPPRDKAYGTIRQADRRPTHASALEGLDALADTLPTEGPVLAYWQRKRAPHLEALGRKDAAYAAWKSAAHNEPDDADSVRAWVERAVERGEDLDAALAAVDHFGEVPGSTAFEPEGWVNYPGWIEQQRERERTWQVLRGRLLLGLERYDEAIAALTRATVSDLDPTAQAHLGLALVATGEDQRAFAHLGRAGVQLEDAALADRVEAELTRLYPVWGAWHPEGRAGHLAQLQGETLASEDDPGTPHSLVGQPLPVTSMKRIGGGTLELSLGEGIAVVDVWATWCGPCVKGMPHLQEVAETYADRGVKVYGLSVDDKMSTVREFFAGVEPPAYDLGFLGPKGQDTLNTHGIPAVFVVRPDGLVSEMILGYGGAEDRRIEAALDALLEVDAESAPAG